MKTNSDRRGFLKRLAGGGLVLGGIHSLPLMRAVEPIQRKGSSRLLLSLAAYSFRQFFGDGQGEARGSGRRINLFDFIDFCADHGCDGTELTSYYFPKDTDTDYLTRIRHHAFLRGIPISGTAVGNNFAVRKGERRDREIASVKQWIDRAQLMAAPHIRVFAGAAADLSKEESKKLCVEALQECCDYAGAKGIMLGLENHGGIVAEAEDLLDIVHSVSSPWFGVNLDTGNFHTADPYADLARCAPYAVNVQVKAEITPKGERSRPADLARLVQILRDANYQGYVALEYESDEDPWTAVPRLLTDLKAAFH